MLLAVFAHIQAHHGIFVAEHEFGQGFGQFGLTNAGRPDENKRADGAAGVFQAGTGAPDGICDGVDGLFLPDDALMQAFFHVQQSLCDSVSSIWLTGIPVHWAINFGNIIYVHDLVQLMLGFPTVTLVG